MADPTEIQESPIVKYDTAPYKLDRDYRSGHHCTRNSAMASILLSNPSYACNNETIIKLMGKGMRVFNFRERTFPNDIKNRYRENPCALNAVCHRHGEMFIGLKRTSHRSIIIKGLQSYYAQLDRLRNEITKRDRLSILRLFKLKMAAITHLSGEQLWMQP